MDMKYSDTFCVTGPSVLDFLRFSLAWLTDSLKKLLKVILLRGKEFYLTKPEVDKIFYFEKFKKTDEFAVNE